MPVTTEQLKSLLNEERRKFQAETQRTSEFYQLVDKMVKRLEARGCASENWPKACDDCRWLYEAKELMRRPINLLEAVETKAHFTACPERVRQATEQIREDARVSPDAMRQPTTI